MENVISKLVIISSSTYYKEAQIQAGPHLHDFLDFDLKIKKNLSKDPVFLCTIQCTQKVGGKNVATLLGMEEKILV